MNLTDQQARTLSQALREGIILYDFKLTETLLLLILCHETLDRNFTGGRVRFDAWLKLLGLESERKLRPHWQALIDVGVVDFNAAQGTFELRPEIAHWSRLRGLRVPQNLRADSELHLVAERPLSEALSELSRESVLQKDLGGPCPALNPIGSQPLAGDPASGSAAGASNPRYGVPASAGNPPAAPPARPLGWDTVRAAIENPELVVPADFSAAWHPEDKSSAAEKSAVAPKPQQNRKTAAEDFSAAALSSLDLSDKSSLDKAAEKSAAAWRWLEETDRHDHLKAANTKKQWEELCRRNPEYILAKLRGRLRTAQAKRHDERKEPLDDPLCYIARIALTDKMLRRIR